MNFHHIGIACKDINESLQTYQSLGYKSNNIVRDKIQKVEIYLLTRKNSPMIELVGAEGKESPINNIIKNNGTFPYHTCYEVDNLEEQISSLISLKFALIVEPAKAIAFNNRKIAFLYNKSIGIIELLEKY